MRILLVTQDFPPDRGGIQTYCDELAQALEARGHAVAVVCPEVGRSYARPTVPVHRLRGPGSWLFVPWAARARALVRAHEATHVLYAQWQLAVLTPRLGVPAGCLVHGRELLTSVLDPATPWLLPRVFRGFEAAFPVSRHVERLLGARTSMVASKVHRVAPGVDPDRFAPRAPERRAGLRSAHGLGAEHVVLLGVGRLAARKNYDRVIACLPALLARNPNVRLVLGGTGPCAPALEAQARALGVTDQVRFLGELTDAELPDVYALGDVFVLPSRGARKDVEGFGIVFLEAAACGLPAVATRSGGIEDAVVDDVTGLLLPEDEPEALARALQRLVEDAELRRRFAVAARRRIVTSLTWDDTAAGIEAGLSR